MTANQAIDGVPRKLRPLLAMILNALDRDATDGKAARGEMASELRALLDAPAKPAPSCVGELERFESDGEDFVKVGDVIDMLGNLKAAQPQGEPVAWQYRIVEDGKPLFNPLKKDGWIDTVEGVAKDMAERPSLSESRHYEVRKLYAEQPAPVAVVLPERMSLEKPEHHTAPVKIHNGVVTGWNACLDELKRLNPTRPAHGNPPPGTEPSGTHHDNDGLDEWRKP